MYMFNEIIILRLRTNQFRFRHLTSSSCTHSWPKAVGDTVDVICSDGYWFSRGMYEDTLTCSINGSWQNIGPCQGKFCHGLNMGTLIDHPPLNLIDLNT